MDNEQTQNKIVIPGYLRISKIIAYLLYVWVLIGIISLVLRVFLLLFSANPATPFVEFVGKVSADYLEPFRGIFPTKAVGETGYLDVAAIFAIIVYLFVMWGFSALVSYVQNKIDMSRIRQQKELDELKKEQEEARIQAEKATVQRQTVTTKTVRVKTRPVSKY